MGEIEEELELIGVYFGASGLVEGAGTGARILKEEAMLSGAFLDGGDVTLDEPAETSVLEQVIEVSELTRERSAAVLERGDVPFVIGGDHSTAFGNIAAACEHFGPEGVGVVYLDAHCDMNTPETSPTGNLHGMPMAALMGYGDPRWCAVARRRLLPENVLLLGARSIDPGERVFVREHGIKVLPVPEPVEGVEGPVLAVIDRFIEERGIRYAPSTSWSTFRPLTRATSPRASASKRSDRSGKADEGCGSGSAAPGMRIRKRAEAKELKE